MTDDIAQHVDTTLLHSYIALRQGVPPASGIDIFSYHDGMQRIKEYLGTEYSEGERAYTQDERSGRCYELACYALAAVPRIGRLVHGSVHGREEGMQRIGHAWLVITPPGGYAKLLWEPLTASLYLHDEFITWARAWPEVEYGAPDVQRLLRRYMHSGPWQEPRYTTKLTDGTIVPREGE